VNQKIPDRDEAELRLAVQGGEPSAASRVFDKRPTSRGALDPAPGSRSYGCARQCVKQNEKRRKSLDTAADVIHGNYPGCEATVVFNESRRQVNESNPPESAGLLGPRDFAYRTRIVAGSALS